MNIHIVNLAPLALPPKEVRHVLHAIQRQLKEHVLPEWGMEAKLYYGLKEDNRADAIIYLSDDASDGTAFGYHGENTKGLPYGFVFRKVSEAIGEPWSVTLSHEVIELLGNRYVCEYAIGPHPIHPYIVFYWYELCDAVQNETYMIENVHVSNFVLPAYFSAMDEAQSTDFLGKSSKSLGIHPGGYVGFYDPFTSQDETYFAKGDKVAQKRFRLRNVFPLRRKDQYLERRRQLAIQISNRNTRHL